MTAERSRSADETDDLTPRDHHTCPVWAGRLLASPLRRLVENPARILAPYVSSGDIAVDVGSAMGFHSLDLARLVGAEGRVICVDIQQPMLDGLVRRARRRGLDGIIEPRLCTHEDLALADVAARVALVVAFNVVHESCYPRRFLSSCTDALAPGGRLLIAEPRGHVSGDEFDTTARTAEALGLAREAAPRVFRSHTALLSRS